MLVLLPSTGGLTSSTENGHRPVARVPVRDRCPPVNPQAAARHLTTLRVSLAEVEPLKFVLPP